jgi:hypothetical protein
LRETSHLFAGEAQAIQEKDDTRKTRKANEERTNYGPKMKSLIFRKLIK